MAPKVSGIILADNKPADVNLYADAIGAMMQAKAREKRYDDVASVLSYRGDSQNPQFAAEAEAFFVWRTKVWNYANEELAKVMGGEREQPTISLFLQEIKDECPFIWP